MCDLTQENVRLLRGFAGVVRDLNAHVISTNSHATLKIGAQQNAKADPLVLFSIPEDSIKSFLGTFRIVYDENGDFAFKKVIVLLRKLQCQNNAQLHFRAAQNVSDRLKFVNSSGDFPFFDVDKIVKPKRLLNAYLYGYFLHRKNEKSVRDYLHYFEDPTDRQNALFLLWNTIQSILHLLKVTHIHIDQKIFKCPHTLQIDR